MLKNLSTVVLLFCAFAQTRVGAQEPSRAFPRSMADSSVAAIIRRGRAQPSAIAPLLRQRFGRQPSANLDAIADSLGRNGRRGEF